VNVERLDSRVLGATNSAWSSHQIIRTYHKTEYQPKKVVDDFLGAYNALLDFRNSLLGRKIQLHEESESTFSRAQKILSATSSPLMMGFGVAVRDHQAWFFEPQINESAEGTCRNFNVKRAKTAPASEKTFVCAGLFAVFVSADEQFAVVVQRLAVLHYLALCRQPQLCVSCGAISQCLDLAWIQLIFLMLAVCFSSLKSGDFFQIGNSRCRWSTCLSGNLDLSLCREGRY